MGVLNVAGYFYPLLALLDHAVSQRFVRSEFAEHIHVSTDPEAIVSDLMDRVPLISRTQPIDLDCAPADTSR